VTRRLDAVVMAAGEGSRMRPLSERWPKPILPVDGRPVIATLLRELAAAGFDAVTIVVGHLGEQIEELLGDGSAFGVRVHYARQPEPLGSADAVVRALGAGATPPLLVTAADILFVRGDLGRVCEEWVASDAPAGLGVRAVQRDRLRHQTLVRVENGRVVAFGGEPQLRGDAVVTGAPVWLVGEEVAGALRSLPGPPYELGSAFSDAIAAGRTVLALEMGPSRDVTRPDDVLERNFPYLSRWERSG
jgi:NDP-sugar pyrophosphorylase family protein